MSSDHRGQILPYRIDSDDLHRFVTARVRGRSADQIRTLGFAPKTWEGTLSSAASLGLLDDKSGDVTGLGRRYAVASAEERAAVLREMLWEFPPFSLLLETALTGNGPQPTPLEWIETWWATHGFGSSESNRVEAAPVFAKLVEAAGLGAYIPGRRGHVSRIEWAEDARLPGQPSPAVQQGAPTVEPAVAEKPAPASRGTLPQPGMGEKGLSTTADTFSAGNLLVWQLSPGRMVQVRVPSDLSSDEKARLLKLFEALFQG
jgi:hypothetical protein